MITMDVVCKKTYMPVLDSQGTVILQKEGNNSLVLLLNKINQVILYVPMTKEVVEEFNIVSEPENCYGESQEMAHCLEDQRVNVGSEDNKIWSQENTLVLIETVKKFDKEFSSGIKKFVWEKVAQSCQYVNKNISAKNCESKWKSLKRTYKTILLANNTSGQKRRYWEYFNVIHEFMFTKPEITPVATASSRSGLHCNFIKETTDQSPPESSSEANEGKENFESSFAKKRKLRISEAQNRHIEKMKRLDRFNDLFEKMINKMPEQKE